MLLTIGRFAVCSLLLPLLLSAATKEHNWKTGKVTADSSVGFPAQHPAAVAPHILIIQGDDNIYTVQEKHAWTGWCLLIQGEEIKYAPEDRSLFVTDADGQNCRLNILTQQKRSVAASADRVPQ